MSQSLKSFLKQRPDNAEILELFKEMLTDGPRGCVLSGGSLLDDALRAAISFRFDHLNKKELEELFEGTAPMATFSARIKVAYAMKVIGPKTRADLDTMRGLRNAFAHGIRKLHFGSASIKDMVDGLSVVKLMKRRREAGINTQETFVYATRILVYWLNNKALAKPKRLADADDLD